MARTKKRRRPPEASAVAEVAPPIHGGHVGAGLGWLGWMLAGFGAVLTLTTPTLRVIGGVTIALGVGLIATGIVVRRRAGHPPTPWHFVVGGVLVALGVTGLLYPCFVPRAELRTMSEHFVYEPLLAVVLAFFGIALLVYGLNRESHAHPEVPLHAHLYRTWLERIGVLWPPNFVRFLLDTWRAIDEEVEAERSARGARRYDWRPLIVFTSGAVFLALMEYAGHGDPPRWENPILSLRMVLDAMDPPGRFGEPTNIWGILRDSPFLGLAHFIWWSVWRVVGFFLLPALVVKLILRERLSDYGLSTAGFRQHAWIYVVFFGFVVLLVIAVSFEPSFQDYYPFYGNASRSWYDFWAWEVLYAAQFFSLEFFFRGFWLKAAKQAMGSYAIIAMVVPYCMIHFGKPFPETIGAIVAGVALGTLALRTRSIWAGFLIHVSIALSMDFAALMQTSGLPDRWWPAL